MVAISLSLLFATINSCLVILQVTLHCYFLSTDNIFCHIGVQKDVLCLPNDCGFAWSDIEEWMEQKHVPAMQIISVNL